MAQLGSLLTRVFAVRFPEDSRFLTQHQFWIQCLDFLVGSQPKVRHPFNRPGKGHVTRRNHALPTGRPLQQLVDARCRQLRGNYQQLLVDGLVSWKLIFFRSYARNWSTDSMAEEKYKNECVLEDKAFTQNSIIIHTMPTHSRSHTLSIEQLRSYFDNYLLTGFDEGNVHDLENFLPSSAPTLSQFDESFC
ncbi:hypothetical protein P9112_010075 [Eukaryota sp. TZLM1-RC]